MNVDYDFARWLLRLELLAGGAAQVIDGRGSPNSEDRVLADPFDREVYIDNDPAPWRERYANAADEAERERVVELLRLAVTGHRFASKATGPLRGTKEWKVAIAFEEKPIEDIVRVYGTSRASIFRYRAQYRPFLAAA